MDRLNGKGEILSQVSLGDVQNHSSFDRHNHNYLTGKLGKLIPTRLDEVYPGDRIIGRIQSVVNFEPLVAPILGNMVLKQESFYIPWHILWKNAHKFVTGKNDFNGTKPKVSPLTIYQKYVSVLGLNFINPYNAASLIGDFRAGYYVSDPKKTAADLFQEIELDYCFRDLVTYITTFGNTYQVLDILQPVIDKLSDYWCKTDADGDPIGKVYLAYTDLYNASSSTADAYFNILVQRIVESYYFIYEYFFGLSSLFDYIGYPVFDGWKDYWLTKFPKYYNNPPVTEDDEKAIGFSMDITKYFSSIDFDWLPFRAYYVVWYWNYRDELLETAALDPESDTFLADTVSDNEIILCTLLRVRCWYKDTFTTALTNTGDGNLSVPIVTEYFSGAIDFKYYSSDTLLDTKDYRSAMESGATVCEITTGGNLTYKVPMNYLSSSFGNSSINDASSDGLSLDLFDRVSRLRKFIQKKLVLGYEYDDVLWSSFLVKLSNVRMRIPEILARGRDVVDINTLVNNTSTNEQAAGDKSAIAWVNGSTSEMNYFAEEHGFYISIMTVLPLQSYAGGMQRLWSKLEQFDIMWPEFASMGMDAVYNFELSAPRGTISQSGLTDQAAMQVFGYQGRYFDLKSRLDEEHGRLRSDLNFLTFSREFNNEFLPKLNYIFVHCWPQTDMFVLADGSDDLFRADVYSSLDWQRRLPVPAEYI